MADYVAEFEKLGFGMFAHYGLYSVLGKGEWAQRLTGISREEYEKTLRALSPER